MASLYQNNAPGRPPGGGPPPPPGGAFRPNHGPQPQHPPPGGYNPNLYGPPPPPPPSGPYNPNPYPGVALPPPPSLPPPPMPPPYAAAPPPPPPSGGPPHPPPPPPPQYHPSAPHYGPTHQPPHHHGPPLQHGQHQPAGPHGPVNPHQQNLGHGNHGPQGSLNQSSNVGHGGSRSHSQQHRPAGSQQVSGLASHQSSRVLGGQQGSLSRGGGSISAGHQSRRPETEEERRERKKREYERSKAEQKKSSQPGATSSRVAPVNGSRDPRTEKRSVAASDKIENRLKRPSTFLCKIRFRNELPDPVSQPKLMHINDKDQYTKYKVTSLENNYKHKLYVEPDLGISLDLLDLSAYNAPQVRPPMDPEDAELLLDDDVVKKETTIRKKERPTDKGVAWLVKTQYISPLSLDPAKQALSEKQAKELKAQREGERLMRSLNDRDQQIQAIEESFRVAKQLPVHQTKPELEAVEVLPLLPYFDRWSDQFVHMIFDSDPTGESEVLSKMDEEMRDEIEARAIVKSYSFPGPDDTKPEKFVAYMVPKPEELERDVYEDGEDISYTWVREYHWDLRTDADQSTYVFCFGENGVNYLPLHTKLILQKKKAKEGRPKEDDAENQIQFAVPSMVTVTRRDLTEEELGIKEEARLDLMEGRIHENNGAHTKRRRSPEATAAPPAKRKVVIEEAVLNREGISDDEEEMSV